MRRRAVERVWGPGGVVFAVVVAAEGGRRAEEFGEGRGRFWRRLFLHDLVSTSLKCIRDVVLQFLISPDTHVTDGGHLREVDT